MLQLLHKGAVCIANRCSTLTVRPHYADLEPDSGNVVL